VIQLLEYIRWQLSKLFLFIKHPSFFFLFFLVKFLPKMAIKKKKHHFFIYCHCFEKWLPAMWKFITRRNNNMNGIFNIFIICEKIYKGLLPNPSIWGHDVITRLHSSTISLDANCLNKRDSIKPNYLVWKEIFINNLKIGLGFHVCFSQFINVVFILFIISRMSSFNIFQFEAIINLLFQDFFLFGDNVYGSFNF